MTRGGTLILDQRTDATDGWKKLLWLLTPATLLMAMDRAVLTVSAPLFQSEFGFTLTQLGFLFTAFFWAYAAMQIPAGALVTRYGPKRTLFVAIVLWSAMTAITPFATTFFALLVVRVLLGIGQSADWPASIVAINRMFTGPQRASANSVLLCALYAGPVIGAPLTGWLLAALGLHGVFLICGLIGFIFAGVFLLGFGEDRPAGAEEHRVDDTAVSFKSLLASRNVWLIATAYICTACLVSFYQTWFPTYLVKARGIGLELVGVYAGVTSIGLCLAALCGGQVARFAVRLTGSQRNGRRAMGALALLVSATASGSSVFASSNLAALCLACVGVSALGLAQVVSWTTVQEVGGEATGSLTGLINLCGNLSAGAAPAVSALLVTWTGSWASSFLFLGAAGVVGALAWTQIRADEPVASSF
jgi:ACS family glucarate transporter-like MFS transporter